MNDLDDRVRQILAIIFPQGMLIGKQEMLQTIQNDIESLLNRIDEWMAEQAEEGSKPKDVSSKPKPTESENLSLRIVELRQQGLKFSEIEKALEIEWDWNDRKPLSKDAIRHRYNHWIQHHVQDFVPETAQLDSSEKQLKEFLEEGDQPEPKLIVDPEENSIHITQGPTSEMNFEPIEGLVEDLRAKGLNTKEIAAKLSEDYSIPKTWQEVRSILQAIGKRHIQKKDQVKPNKSKSYMDTNYKHHIELVSQDPVDKKIIEMKKLGLLDFEIAQNLERSIGGQWSIQKIMARYTRLKRIGAV